MAWQTPKTDWGPADAVRDTDFNRIEGNILELHNGTITEHLTVHVSASGNDDSGLGTSASPYRTITKALSVIPKNLNGKTVAISIATGTYAEDITIKDFSCGTLNLVANGSGRVSVNSITIINCVVKADFITLATLSGIGILVTDNATFIAGDSVYTDGTSAGIAATNCSRVSVGGVLTANNASTAVMASNNSSVFVYQLAGEGIGTAFSAFNGGQITYGNLNATVETAIAATSSGGRVFTGSQS